VSTWRYVRDGSNHAVDLAAWLDRTRNVRWISLRPARARRVTDAEIDLADLAGVRLLVQGDAELALERGLHGVELRPRGRTVEAARRLLGPERTIALDLRDAGGGVPEKPGEATSTLAGAPSFEGAVRDLTDVDVALLQPGTEIPGSLPVVAVYATVPLSSGTDP